MSLVFLVENVLEMSRRRIPSPHRLSLVEYLENFVSDFKDARPEAEITVVVNPRDTEIRVDAAHLNQALTNLVENGLRYSQENGAGPRVDLQAGLDAGSERPFLNIVDYGVGVDQEQEAKLFEPFATTAEGGTGLGLYISRELCETNQAQLSYLRSADDTSIFRILFAHPDRITI